MFDIRSDEFATNPGLEGSGSACCPNAHAGLELRIHAAIVARAPIRCKDKYPSFSAKTRCFAGPFCCVLMLMGGRER